MAHRKLRTLTFATFAVSAIAGACGSTKDSTTDPGGSGQSTALLTRATSCDDLLARIHADAIAQLDVVAEQALMGMTNGGFRGGPTIGIGESGGDDLGQGGAPVPAADPGSATGSSQSEGVSGPTSYSDTNVQVEGVDEADIVKTDGERIYLLHGSELFVLKSFPAAESAVIGSAGLEGESRELFVADGKAVAFTSLYGAEGLYDVDGSDDAKTSSYYGGTPFTKITVLDVEGETPEVLREVFVEGNYLTSRRHGATVRAIMNDGFKVPTFYPDIQYTDPWGVPYPESELRVQLDAWKERMTAAIEDSSLDRWLPLRREKVDGEIRAVAPVCSDYYVPRTGMTQPGVTSVVSFDLDGIDADFGGATILGDAHEVYANQDKLLLAHNDYRWQIDEGATEQTALHQFDISEGANVYEGSGLLPGYIHDQFSLDERDGVIRLATTERIYERVTEGDAVWIDQTNQVSRVTTMGLQEGALVEIGATDDFGDGEEIFSARFVGDRGYVVTYMQTDPLFVIDLSDAENPEVLGHLEIPGFSDYMHPIDDDHLLTIGRETEVQPEGWVADVGLQLQIFDVSDPLTPTRTHQHLYTTEGYSEANNEHKAFTFYADKGLLAFPFTSYGTTFRSSLEVFRVDVNDGFEQLGSIDHTALLESQCVEAGQGPYCDPSGWCEPAWCAPQQDVRRGLFIDDSVYSISYAGMLVHDMADLTTPVATVPLPLPTFDGGDYYVDAPPSTGTSGGTNASSGDVTEPAPPTAAAPPSEEPASVDGGAATP